VAAVDIAEFLVIARYDVNLHTLCCPKLLQFWTPKFVNQFFVKLAVITFVEELILEHSKAVGDTCFNVLF